MNKKPAKCIIEDEDLSRDGLNTLQKSLPQNCQLTEWTTKEFYNQIKQAGCWLDLPDGES